MENFPQTYEPTGSMSILEQFVGLKNFMNNKLNSNEFIKSTPQELTEQEKAQARENIGAGASTINVIDNLTSQSNIDALSANQGRVLNEKIDSRVQELQNDIDANGGDIAGLQGDVSELNQTMQRTLKTPLATPPETLIVGIDDNGDQFNLNVRNGLFISNNSIGVEHPVGSFYFCSHGSNSPASVFGGTWQKIAENVVLPFGSSAPVVTGSEHYMSGELMLWRDVGGKAIQSDLYNIGLYNTNEGKASYSQYGQVQGIYNAIAPSNLQTDLSQSTNAISGVDIWRRES